MDERRRFERIDVPASSRLTVLDEDGKKLGRLKMLGRGGMLFECQRAYTLGTKQTFHISDDPEGIVCEVHAVVRYNSKEGLGVEFEKLDTDAAVDIGVWIGKYYPEKQ